METVDLLEILFSIRKRWKMILLICIITTLLAGLYSYMIAKPVYQSTVSVYVFKEMKAADGAPTYNDLLGNNQMAKNYKVLIMSKQVLNDVRANLNMQHMNHNSLQNMINVSLQQDTSYLLITVKNADPKLAMNIANEVANVFTVKVKDIMKIDNVRVIDAAEEASAPISPNKKLNMILGIIIGLVLGVGLAFALDFFDNKIRYPEDLKKRYKYTLIGAIPVIEEYDDDKVFAQKDNKYIISENSKIFETYRSIRTNIMFASVDKPYKTILVTSSIPGEGKTTCSVNLAMAFARAGSKTIIVDVDLRKPRVHKAFNLNTVKGLTSVLAADIETERVIKNNVFENLDVLPAGIRPPNPAELLGSQAMKKLIMKLEEIYDIVILDAPPVSVFTDAATIAGRVDGTVYIVSSGIAGNNELARGIDNLNNVNASIIGFVMTRVEKDAKGREYYNYKYSYYYGDRRSK